MAPAGTTIGLMDTTDMKSGLDPASFSSVITPADDLFRYVNGPWIDTFRLPDDKPRFGAFEKLAEDAESQLHDILEDAGETCPKSKALYDAFMDTEAIEKAGMEPIRGELAAIDGAADKAELTRVLGALAPFGGPTPFSWGVDADADDPSVNMLSIGQSGIGMPDESYYREERHEAIRSSYRQMVTRLLTLAGYAKPEESAARLLTVETAIASKHWDNVTLRDPVKTHNPTTLEALAGVWSHFDLNAWLDAWQTAYDASPAAAAQPVSIREAFAKVDDSTPEFSAGFDALWDSLDVEDLKLWARVHVLIGWASYLSRDFDQAAFDFYGRTLRGTTVQRDRWKRAVSLVDGVLGEEIGQEYVRRHFPESSKKRMEELVANLIEAYRISISHSDWLGEATQAKALEKLSKFKPMIGYTNHWRDYTALDVAPGRTLVDDVKAANIYEAGHQLAKAGKSVDREEWEMNPQTVNAYYHPTRNVIVFPAAILQPPFFDPEAEDAANYGGIGAVIGHEIGHGFDDQGSQFDGDGKLNNWWTDEDRAAFEARTGALIAQYDAFVPKQLLEGKYADDPSKAPHVTGALTIGENIGDLGGVTIASKAYAFSLDPAAAADGSAEAIEAALDKAPVIDGLTGVQRFFLSYAAIWRMKIRDELCEQFLQIDPHSPAEFRANGIARNADLFYKAFDVPAGSPMYLAPEDRVRIW